MRLLPPEHKESHDCQAETVHAAHGLPLPPASQKSYISALPNF